MGLPPGDHFADETFEGLDASGVEFTAREFHDCRFVRCAFSGTEFRECRLASCTFDGCDLSLLRLPDTRLESVRFVDAKAIGIDWTRARWAKVPLEPPVGFRGCALDDSVFLGLSLPRVAIRDCTARRSDFREADLSEADFGGTDLTGALFGNTRLARADLTSARNYRIVPAENVLEGAKFALPEAMSLLHCLGIELDHGGEDD